jgi:outer membrane protein OmpA-like peptidoglycan-associated protein
MKKLILFICTFPIFAYANVVGVDTQNFNPTTSGLDFVTVHSSKTLSPGVINFGFFLNYAVNTLPNYEDTSTSSRFEPKDSLLSMDLNMGFGILNNWDVGISLPQVLSQTVDENSTAFRGQFEQTGINEVRLNTKYRIWDAMSQGIAVIGSVNFFMIENFPFTGDQPGPTYNIEVAYDNTINQFTWGVNLGYRARDPGTPITIGTTTIQPFGNQYLASVAGSYYFTDWDFKIIGEIYGAIPAEEIAFTSDRDQSVAEVLLGAKWDMMYDIAGHFGVGSEIVHGTASPDWRAYAGINWTFGPIFSSGEQAPASDYIVDELNEEMAQVGEGAPATETPVVVPDYTYIDEPEAFIAAAPKNDERFLAKNVLFEFNGTSVRSDFKPYLKKLADYLLKGNGFKQLIVIGHTDSVGSDTYNLNLSVKRSRSVAEVIKDSLPPEHREKVRAEGEGERSPIASNRNYQGRALNRRVEFFVKREGSAEIESAGVLNSATPLGANPGKVEKPNDNARKAAAPTYPKPKPTPSGKK